MGVGSGQRPWHGTPSDGDDMSRRDNSGYLRSNYSVSPRMAATASLRLSERPCLFPCAFSSRCSSDSTATLSTISTNAIGDVPFASAMSINC